MSIKPRSKYYPLFEHLQHCNQETVTFTFAEIEALMGCSLPASARNKKNWWSNRDSSSALQAIAWISASQSPLPITRWQNLLPLRLFKCRMWLWLVIPGLHDAEPTKLMTGN